MVLYLFHSRTSQPQTVLGWIMGKICGCWSMDHNMEGCFVLMREEWSTCMVECFSGSWTNISFSKENEEKNNLSKLLDSHLINVPYLFNEDIVASPFIIIHFPHTQKFPNFAFPIVGELGSINVQCRSALCWAELIKGLFWTHRILSLPCLIKVNGNHAYQCHVICSSRRPDIICINSTI